MRMGKWTAWNASLVLVATHMPVPVVSMTMSVGIKYYRNEGTATNPSYSDRTSDGSINPFGIWDADTFSPYKGQWTPHGTQLVDLDGDGTDDFIMMADNGANGDCLRFFKGNECKRKKLGIEIK